VGSGEISLPGGVPGLAPPLPSLLPHQPDLADDGVGTAASGDEEANAPVGDLLGPEGEAEFLCRLFVAHRVGESGGRQELRPALRGVGLGEVDALYAATAVVVPPTQADRVGLAGFEPAEV